jgi:hypothetical protein
MKEEINLKDVVDAIQILLWGTGATLQMRSDDQHYTEILIQYTASKLNIELG